MARHQRSAARTILRALVVLGLLYDAYVHIHLAGNYQRAQPAGVGEGNLFRIEAVLALLGAAYLAFRPTRTAFLTAAVIAGGGAIVVVVYRYVDLPAFGPFTAMYEPIWFTEKSWSAVVEAAAGIFALVGWALTRPVPPDDGDRARRPSWDG